MIFTIFFSAQTNKTGYSNPLIDQCQCSRLLDESVLPWVKFVLFLGHTLPKNQILEIRANLGVVHHMFSRILNLPNLAKLRKKFMKHSLFCFSKCQLISKGLSKVFICTKKGTKIFLYFCHS